MHHASGGRRPANATRDRRRLYAIHDRVAVLGAEHQTNRFELTHRANFVVDHPAGERDATYDIFGDVTTAARLGPRDPEASRGVHPCGDVGKPALEIGDAVD